MQVEADGAAVCVTLRGELGVADVAQLCERLVPLLHRDAELVIDAGGVERVDTAAAQLFFIASRGVAGFRCEAPSDAWASAWRDLGFDRPGTQTTGAIHGEDDSER